MRATDVTQPCPPEWLKPRRGGRMPRRFDTIIAVDGEGITRHHEEPELAERRGILEEELWQCQHERQALRDTLAGTRGDRIDVTRDGGRILSLTALRRGMSIDAAAQVLEDAREWRARIRQLGGEIRSLREQLRALPPAPAHDYVLLAASTGQYVEGRSLQTRRCLDFLLSLPRQSLVVGYSFGYDINMMLRDLPLEALERLAHTGRVRWGRYRLLWHQGKEFRISLTDRSRSVTVWDVFGFFQCSFVKALSSWGIGSAADIEKIASMKDLRGTFSTVQRAEIRRYCLQECTLLVKMVRRLVDATQAVEIPLRRYDGAGAIGGALLRKHAVDRYIRRPPEEVQDAVMGAYYGGRFESSRIGFCGDGWCYDINSAYPSSCVDLPCLVCGDWSPVSGVERTESRASLFHVRWSLPVVPHWPTWGPFPWRSPRGAIVYPVSGESWIWRRELDAGARLVRRWGGELEVLGGWGYTTGCDHRPFGFVPDLYSERKRLQATGSFASKALKLGLNSIYGKTAQSIGHPSKPPRYQCHVWAGLITSGCRAEILDALDQDPDAIVAIATDGIISTRPLDLDCGDALGQWEDSAVEDIFLAQNGVYRYRKDGEEIKRNRGFTAREFDFDAIGTLFVQDRERTEWKTSVPRFIGIRTALHRNPPLYGWRRWVSVPRTVRLFPRNRVVESAVHPGERTPGHVRTFAWKLGESVPQMSTAYTPKMTWEERETDLSLVEGEQPA